MSKERPSDDPRDQTDWPTHRQKDEPWKGTPQEDQKPEGVKSDLEKWQETNTH